MNFLENISGRLKNLFSDSNDEILFFVMAFLILFNNNIRDAPASRTDE